MEAVVNTVHGQWQAQDNETISQKSLLGRLPACSLDTQQQNGVHVHVESFLR